jgi:hypothetical protein
MLCQICNKDVSPGEIYCYTDWEHNLVNVEICELCLEIHLKEYWPNSPILIDIRYNAKRIRK